MPNMPKQLYNEQKSTARILLLHFFRKNENSTFLYLLHCCHTKTFHLERNNNFSHKHVSLLLLYETQLKASDVILIVLCSHFYTSIHMYCTCHNKSSKKLHKEHIFSKLLQMAFYANECKF